MFASSDRKLVGRWYLDWSSSSGSRQTSDRNATKRSNLWRVPLPAVPPVIEISAVMALPPIHTKHGKRSRSMVYLNVLLTAKDPADAPAIADALRRAGALSKQEPGCLRWEAYQAKTQPHR